MAGSLRSPVRGTRRPVCAPQPTCVYANVALGVDIDSCSLGTAGDWSRCLSRVLLSAPLPQPVCYPHKQSGETGRPGDIIRCFELSWSHVRKHVSSARLCCFKQLWVVYPTSQSDAGKVCSVAIWSLAVQSTNKHLHVTLLTSIREEDLLYWWMLDLLRFI